MPGSLLLAGAMAIAMVNQTAWPGRHEVVFVRENRFEVGMAALLRRAAYQQREVSWDSLDGHAKGSARCTRAGPSRRDQPYFARAGL